MEDLNIDFGLDVIMKNLERRLFIEKVEILFFVRNKCD